MTTSTSRTNESIANVRAFNVNRPSTTKANRTRRSRIASARANATNDIQLGTAVIDETIDTNAFTSAMYAWASTLTSSGQNLPFASSLKVDAVDGGFAMEFLESDGAGGVRARGRIETRIDAIDGERGKKAFVITGSGGVMNCVDTPVVMGAMPRAIRAACAAAKK